MPPNPRTPRRKRMAKRQSYEATLARKPAEVQGGEPGYIVFDETADFDEAAWERVKGILDAVLPPKADPTDIPLAPKSE